jgi:hypothetical protein
MPYAPLSEGFSLVDTETPRAVRTFSNMFWKYDLVGNLNRNTRPPLKDKNWAERKFYKSGPGRVISGALA